MPCATTWRARASPAPDARVWAVVKANAYGHGIERVFEGLRGADGFALLDLAEAERLRALGWRGPILLLEGVFEPRDLELCSRLGLWHTVHCDEQIDMLALHKTHEPHRVFLKMNSGMNRLGFAPHRYRSAWTRLQALPQVDEISLMTHFSDADGPKGIEAQMQVFADTTRDLPGERTLSNSAATLRHAQDAGVRADWVRAGIAMYGSAPDHPLHQASDWGLMPTMTLAARIIGVQQLQAGDSVGYGSTFTADQRPAHRRGRLRLCRWLPAGLPDRHPGAGRRPAQPDPGAREHGHAGRGPERSAASRIWQHRDDVGPGSQRRSAVDRPRGRGCRHAGL